MLLMLPQVVAPLATMDRKIENSQIIVSIVSVIGALVTLAVVTGLAFWLVHSITRPLKAMRLVATEIAQSSTGAVAPGLHNDVQGGQDEIGEFVQEFKTMVRTLHEAGIEVILDVMSSGDFDEDSPAGFCIVGGSVRIYERNVESPTDIAKFVTFGIRKVFDGEVNGVDFCQWFRPGEITASKF